MSLNQMPQHLRQLVEAQLKKDRPRRRVTDKRARQIIDQAFTDRCVEAGLPDPCMEHQFHPDRKWRFDYAWSGTKVALEVEGGVWTAGRHVRGKGFLGDVEKYNEAGRLGWIVLKTTPKELLTDATVALVADTIQARGQLP